MKNKILFAILIVILISPIIEIIIEMSTPVLGGNDSKQILTEQKKNYFFYSAESDSCLKSFIEKNDMPENCYSNSNDIYSKLYNAPNKPHITSIDYNQQQFDYTVKSFITFSDIVGSIASHGNLKGYCYLKNDELTSNSYNLSKDNDSTLYRLSPEYKEMYLKRISRSVASNFMLDFDGSNYENVMPETYSNYKVGGIRNNNHLQDYQLLVGWLLFEKDMGRSLQLFEDNCTFYTYLGPYNSKLLKSEYTEYKTGIPAEQIRKEYAEFFSINLKRMEYFEKILFNNKIEENIFYLSYYPGYKKIWVIVKIPEEKLQGSTVFIDGKSYDYELTYPFIFVNIDGLVDGKHTFDIKTNEKSFTIDFYVSNLNIFINGQEWTINKEKIQLTMLNYYPQDVIITKMIAINTGQNINCESNVQTVIPHNASYRDTGTYIDVNSTLIVLNCQGLDKYLDHKVALNWDIYWHFINETSDQNKINHGELIGTVESWS